MSRKMLSALCLILALLCCLPLIASCGDKADGPKAGETTAAAGEKDPADTEAAETEPLLHYQTLEKDFGGQNCRIMVNHNANYDQFTNFEVVSEGENGEIVNDAVYRRNSLIFEKFNVGIETITIEDTNAQSTEMYTALTKNIMSGEDAAEIFFIAQRDAGKIIMNGYSYDMNDLPYVDYTQPYWNQHTVNDLTLEGVLYLCNSDFSLVDKKRTYILTYNRDLLHEYSDLNLEDMVHDGTWTYDQFIKLCEAVSSDLNGDGIIDWNDQWGVGMDSPHACCAFLVGMNGRLITKDKNGLPVSNIDSAKTIEIANMLYDTLHLSKNLGFECSGVPTWKSPDVTKNSQWSGYMFRNERTLFSTSFPQSLPQLSANVDFDYGAVVWPKYDEAQDDYYTFADKWGCVLFGVPYIAQNTELAGFMLEVLSGYSTDTSLEAYYEISCKVKYTYDETSAEMLDIALKSLTYDLGAIFDWGGLYSNFTKLIFQSSNNYVSACASIADKVQSEMEATLEAIAASKG